jgi:uncharacterized protein
MYEEKKILVTGASGLVGGALCQALKEQGYVVYQLVRHLDQAGEGKVVWDYQQAPKDLAPFEGFYAVIHLAGENIATFWTEEKKKRLISSRVETTKNLSHLLSTLARPPEVFITASAIGFYGDRKEDVVTEDSGSGDGFLATLCRDWEAATEEAKAKGIRVVSLRIGVVLSEKGGLLKKMQLPFKLCLGGILGSGHQYMSWIVLEDLVRAFIFLLEKPSIWGAVNGCSPYPVTNAEFTKALGKVLNRPTVFTVPAKVLRFFFEEMADELLLSSARVHPKRLLKADFVFHYPKLEDALCFSHKISDSFAK